MRKLLFSAVVGLLLISSVVCADEIKQLQIDSVNLGGKHIKPKQVTTPKLILIGYTRISGYLSARVENYPTGAYTKVAYNTTDFDTLSEFNTTTSSFTATYAGLYYIDATVDLIHTVADRSYGLAIFKNGVNTKVRLVHSTLTNEMNVSNSVLLQLNADDIIDFRFYNGDGDSTTDIEGSSLQTWFSIFRIPSYQ